jgi:hypothetical protein
MPEPVTSLTTESPDVLYTIERRRFPRVPVPDVVVGLELPEAAAADDPAGFAWVGSAIDLSLDGMSLALPDDVPLGSEVLLTFRLDDRGEEVAFVRVPAIVVRRKPGFGQGAVLFLGWDHAEWEALRAYLDRR